MGFSLGCKLTFTLVLVGELRVLQWKFIRGSLKFCDTWSKTNIALNLKTTCWAWAIICSKNVSSVAIFNKVFLSAALGPAIRRLFETPTGEELSPPVSGFRLFLWAFRSNWCRECSRNRKINIILKMSLWVDVVFLCQSSNWKRIKKVDELSLVFSYQKCSSDREKLLKFRTEDQ